MNKSQKIEEAYKNAKVVLSEYSDCTPILIAITGSTAYGTDVESSDIDIKGVYIQDLDSILKTDYVQQIGGTSSKTDNDERKRDLVLYELTRFSELLATNNPNILELLNLPEDCILYEHDIWKSYIGSLKLDNILSKKCKNTFGDYAKSQINKAQGLNKNIVNPMPKKRKTPIDFCYVIDESESRPLKKYLEVNKFDELFCGVVNVPHARDIYSLYYDEIADKCFSDKYSEADRELFKKSRKDKGLNVGLGYKGIQKENSNTIRLSSIPKGEKHLINFYYNKDGYVQHCKKHNQYWKWVDNRNEERYETNISHQKNYDSKNMMHCHRLLDMVLDIFEKNKIIVRRDNVDELLKIRRGEYTYDDILNSAMLKVKKLDSVYEESNLRELPDTDAVKLSLLNTKKEFYKLNN